MQPLTERPRRESARAAARKAVRRGNLKRQPCQRCQQPRSEMHHPDYSLPLYVVWLCRHCHRRLHQIKLPVEVFLMV